MGCDIHLHVEKRVNGEWEETECNNVYDGRNYTLYAALAGVRNYDRFTPIAEPKELPKDVSAEVYNESERWGCDGHSHSWLTLTELLNFDWSQKIKITRMVSAESRRQYLENGITPNAWCSWTNTEGWDSLEWEESLAEYCNEFINEFIPELQKLGNPDEVRIVFWFDN